MANKDCSLCYGVTTTAERGTPVNGMLIVKTFAGGIKLNKLVTHDLIFSMLLIEVVGFDPKLIQSKGREPSTQPAYVAVQRCNSIVARHNLTTAIATLCGR